VRVRHQPADQRLALRVAQVARDRLLVASLDEPPVGTAGGRRDRTAEAAQVVADAWLLHLDHVGAELAEQGRAHRRGQVRRQIEDGDAGEGVAGLGHGAHLTALVLRFGRLGPGSPRPRAAKTR
jgi:hypothetical protein